MDKTRSRYEEQALPLFRWHLTTGIDDVAVTAMIKGNIWIDFRKLDETAAALAQKEMPLPKWDYPVFLNSKEGFTTEQIIASIILGNTVNSGYNNIETKSKYYTIYGTGRDGKPAAWKGADGMWASLKRAIEEGYGILDGDYLSRITAGEVAGIFNRPDQQHVLGDGFTTYIPLLEERAAILREVGHVLTDRYSGSFYNVFRDSNGRLFDGGKGFLERLIGEFPSFRDVESYFGRPVGFYKRAQLAAAMLHEKLIGMGETGFPEKDIGELTVFVDYNLPAILRKLGILNYGPDLARKVDAREEIPRGSSEEIEIRATTMKACNMLEARIKEANPDKKITALHVDYLLWSAGRGAETVPHLTGTTMY